MIRFTGTLLMELLLVLLMEELENLRERNMVWFMHLEQEALLKYLITQRQRRNSLE